MSIAIQGASAPAQPSASHLPASIQSTAIDAGRPYVYVLPRKDFSGVKIGRSIDPLERIAGLLNIYPEIDLSRAVILSVDSLRIESVLHTVFESRREKLPVRKDGYTEWFNGDFVDEVVDFCQRIAQHRGRRIEIITDIERHLQEYRRRNLLAGTRAPRLTREQAQARRIATHREMNDLASESAVRFIEALSEKAFDGVVIHREQYFLVRTVHRQTEPECWLQSAMTPISDWSRKFVQAAQVSIHVDGGTCRFNFVKTPTFEAQDDRHGIEIYRLSQSPVEADPSPDSLPMPDSRAFEVVWDHLATFEVLDSAEVDHVVSK